MSMRTLINIKRQRKEKVILLSPVPPKKEAITQSLRLVGDYISGIWTK